VARGRVSRLALTARAVWGATLVVAPRTVLEQIGGPASPRWATGVVRVLGARHLLQCGFEVVGGASGLGVAADLLHAATDIGLAVADRQWRRAALTDAGITLGLVGVGRRRRLSGASW
jgi:hypothetical protein